MEGTPRSKGSQSRKTAERKGGTCEFVLFPSLGSVATGWIQVPSISGLVELVGREHLQARPITPLLLAWRGMDFLACVGM